ncbi:MAG: ATP-binding protein involved in chromosome partitioning [Methanobacteriota archaeon]|jgi:ATP-binding protein involved in chromosome partitioning|uniref:Iron-sulfur cluster carrier protein n=1 Tax=Halorutilus salinus TaxID=2487751 RepID=A0A9Q4C3Z5_9EURY|nr:Mrp/NBP35 family ATP-binding protein [Halorutilus salinus]MCX2818034.1 Mrp/NBP35 family ATP-binding protein [Halorutilus salinus]
MNEEQVHEVLSEVEDPVLEDDIESLGLVKNVEMGEEDIVSVSLAFDAPHSPAETMMAERVGKVLANEGLRPRLRTEPPRIPSKLRDIKNTIAVTSGKGGVGKTTVAANLAAGLDEMGAEVGILDGDIHGPNVPHKMALEGELSALDDKTLVPPESNGVKVMSLHSMLPDGEAATLRGPKVHKVLDTFTEEVEWGGLDYLVIDMPPGTGDVPIWLVQTLEVTGAVVVTTPQQVAVDDSRRGVRMFQEHDVPVLGVVENMREFRCTCGSEYELFGAGGGNSIADEYDLPVLESLPLSMEMEGRNVPIARDYDSEMGDEMRVLGATVADHIGMVNRMYVSRGRGGGPLRASK